MADLPPTPTSIVPTPTPLPAQLHDPAIHFIIGKARIPGSNEPKYAVITFYSVVNQAVTNKEADVLIQKKMAEIGYVHSGWSKERALLRYNWNKWLEETVLYAPDTNPEVREACLSQVQSRVKHFSTKWRKLGLWTVQGKHFCTVCRVPEGRSKDREESNVTFSPWLLQQVLQNGDWNGEFTEGPPTVLCPHHLSVSIRFSPYHYNFTPEILYTLRAQLDTILRDVWHLPPT